MIESLDDLMAAGLLGFFLGVIATLFLNLEISLIVFSVMVMAHAASYLLSGKKES